MRRFARSAAVVLVVALLALAVGPLAGPARAQPSAPPPDTSYGDEGVALIEVPHDTAGISHALNIDDAIVDREGRLVVTGDPVHGDLGPVVLRFTADGDLDTTFAGDGSAELPVDWIPSELIADGNDLLVEVLRQNGESDPVRGIYLEHALVRVLDDGTLDAGFGGGAPVVLDIPYPRPFLGDIVARDGRVVVSRFTLDDEGLIESSELVALGADGQPDPTFGDEGIVTIDDGVGSFELPGEMAFDRAGRLIVEIGTWDGPDGAAPTTTILRRLSPDGAPDPSFGTGGTADLGQVLIHELSVGPVDDKIVFATVKAGDVTLRRRAANGAADPSFGQGGVVTVDLGEPVWPLALHIDPAGNLLLGGEFQDESTEEDDTVIVRLGASGILDRSVGDEGRITIADTPSEALVVERPDRILLVGTDYRNWPDLASEIHAYRLDAPPAAPLITEVHPHAGALSVSWQPGSPDPLSPTRAYLVVALEDGEVRGYTAVAGDVRQASVAGLTNGVEVDVVVYAYNRLGPGAASASASGTPSGSADPVIGPGPVQDLEVVAGNGHVTATWAPPTHDGGNPIAGYAVLAVRKSNGAIALWRNVPADVRTLSLGGLGNGAALDVYVLAYSAKGFGAVAAPVVTTPTSGGSTAQTPEVSWASAQPISATHAVVTWGPPTERGDATSAIHVIVLIDGAMTQWKAMTASDRQVVVPAPPGAEVYVVAQSPSGFGPLAGPLPV